MPERSTRRAEFLAGFRDTLPLELGGIPFGIIFGAIAVNSGLSPAATMGMSLFVFAGSSQFIGAGLVGQGVAIPFIILTTFVVNLRHALYSATLSLHMRHLPQRWLVPLGFWLTDESFAIVIRRYTQPDDSPHKHWYFLGSALFMYVNWNVCTLIGLIAGQVIPNAQDWGFEFAMVATFIGLTVPMLKDRPMVIAALVGGVAAVLANGLPNKLGLMLGALVGVAAGMIAEAVFKPTPAVVVNEETST
ncbi:MAG: AzlC family ABC transporter permease [Chloroflexota bacterium]